MPALRTIGVPLEHLVAELRAFPFASEWALANPFSALDARLTGFQSRLWVAAERELLTTIPGFSVDELRSLRDALWFEPPRSGSGEERRQGAIIPLHQYLRRLACDSLVVTGGVARPRRPDLRNDDDPRLAPQVTARQAWRWLTFALPPDLLAGALAPSANRIEVLSPAVERVLADAGFAETHVHLGAALDFSTIWPGALGMIASRDFDPKHFFSPGASFDGGTTLAPWLVHAALARYLLGVFLVQRTVGESFGAFLARTRAMIAQRCGIASYGLARRALAELRRGKLMTSDFSELRELYAELAGTRRLLRPTMLADWPKQDPLSRLYGDATNIEVAYVAAGLRYLHEPLDHDKSLFTELFWQTVRVRCALYRFVVQRPLTPGLAWFVRFYNRMAKTRGDMPDSIRLQVAAVTSGAGAGLRSLEVRTAPARSGAQVLALVKATATEAQRLRQRSPGLEVGLVLHFIKDRGDAAALWAGTHADPSLVQRAPDTPQNNRSGIRYGTYFQDRRREAEALVWTLHHFPESTHIVRGIDVCTDELGVPNWVLAPLVRYVKRNARLAQGRARGVPDQAHFGTTVHAGEDFVHLMTGLRNLDEAIEAYELGEGDRIGHGLALGVAPGEWARRAGRLSILREDRLFDLVWVWQWLSRASIQDGAGVRHYEREIRDHATFIFDDANISPYDVLRLMQDLDSEAKLRLAGFPDRQRRARLGLMKTFLTDARVFDRGRRTVFVDPVLDLEMLERLQVAMRAKVIARGITIEVNPTSNLLIGDFGDLSRHPLWRLRPPRHDTDVPELSLCIGSDDPSVFASNLREEYQWLEDAMRLAGVSDEEARCWLDRTRACGLEARFTLPPPATRLLFEAAPRGEMERAPL